MSLFCSNQIKYIIFAYRKLSESFIDTISVRNTTILNFQKSKLNSNKMDPISFLFNLLISNAFNRPLLQIYMLQRVTIKTALTRPSNLGNYYRILKSFSAILHRNKRREDKAIIVHHLEIHVLFIFLPFNTVVPQLSLSFILTSFFSGRRLPILKILYFLASTEALSISLHGQVTGGHGALYIMPLGLELVIENYLIGFGLYLVVVEGVAELFNGNLGFSCIALLSPSGLFGQRTFLTFANAVIPVNLFTHYLFYWDFYQQIYCLELNNNSIKFIGPK